MKTIKKQWLVTIAVCTVALCAVASTKKPVERPIAWKGVSTVVVDVSKADEGLVTWKVASETGTSEHLGLYTSHGGGEVVFDTQGNMIGLVGDGDITAANGDKVYWHMEQTFPNPGVITFKNGTGRFQNASGTATEQTVVLSDTGLTITQSVDGKGTIAY